MTSQAYFWIAAGFMAGLAVSFFALRLWQVSATVPGQRRVGLPLAVVGFVIAAVGLYRHVGQPEAAASPRTADAWPAHAGAATATPSAGSMIDAINALQAKLAAGSGSEADWQLLAQSYQFIGDQAAAERAAKHELPAAPVTAAIAGPATADTAPAPSGPAPVAPATTFRQAISRDLQGYEQRVAAAPTDASAWRALAEGRRTARQFAAANTAFERLIALNAMDASTWADYADSAASLRGSLDNDLTRRALAAALQLNPKHPKSLWLQASLLLEQRRYAQALTAWQQLRAVIADGSADAAIIDANIAEARSLAGGAHPAVTSAQVSGTVTLSGGAAAPTGLTLFVFAKAPDSPAPVAVFRTTVRGWPVSFTLDDSLAMLPNRKLSNYPQVRVQARLSATGQATAQAGDWQSVAVSVATQHAAPVSLSLAPPES